MTGIAWGGRNEQGLKPFPHVRPDPATSLGACARRERLSANCLRSFEKCSLSNSRCYTRFDLFCAVPIDRVRRRQALSTCKGSANSLEGRTCARAEDDRIAGEEIRRLHRDLPLEQRMGFTVKVNGRKSFPQAVLQGHSVFFRSSRAR